MSSPVAAAVHGGHLVARALQAAGVTHVFTLSGAHIFPIYDGCREAGIHVVDVRHEQTAAFAAEAWGKVTGTPGVAVVTAGPGVTNCISALAGADAHGSPMLVIGGRAPQHRWGQGSLQEFDHIPVVTPVTRLARTVTSVGELTAATTQALAPDLGGPAFLDIPLDVLFDQGEAVEAPEPPAPAPVQASGNGPDGLAMALERAERVTLFLGSGSARAARDLVPDGWASWARAHDVAVIEAGLARGTMGDATAPGAQTFREARSRALGEAELVIVVGQPIDFRLGFGQVFGDDAMVVHVDAVADLGGLAGVLAHSLPSGDASSTRAAWLDELRATERDKRATWLEAALDEREPLHPVRVLAELDRLLGPDDTVVVDAGDFGSFAGRTLTTSRPGHFLDPGPFGCLGAGPGQALAAQLARPDARTALILGDGSFGFAGMEFDTFVRHGIPVVGVLANNGLWGLEHHPMEALFGYSMANELRPEARYDQVVAALGGHGERVERVADLRPALERAFASGKPALVDVRTDPDVAYPRRTNLA